MFNFVEVHGFIVCFQNGLAQLVTEFIKLKAKDIFN